MRQTVYDPQQFSRPAPASGDVLPPEPPPPPQFTIPISGPTVGRIVLGIDLLVFVAMILYGFAFYGIWDGPQNLRVLYDFGAKWNPAILQGEFWRLFTSMFLHIGAIHLLFNMYALYVLGPFVEGYFGHWRFLTIYIIGGLFGSVASFAFSPALSAGASGAIFGLLGAVTIYFFRYREHFGARGRAILQNMLFVIGINLVLGLTIPGIDNWAHMGGLLGGAFTAWGLLPQYRLPQIVRPGVQPMEVVHRPAAEIGWTLFCVMLLILAFQIARFIGVPTL
jgi:rhomboid protease GluP